MRGTKPYGAANSRACRGERSDAARQHKFPRAARRCKLPCAMPHAPRRAKHSCAAAQVPARTCLRPAAREATPHSGANSRTYRPCPAASGATPYSAATRTNSASIFNLSLPSRQGRPSAQRVPRKTTSGGVPHRNAAANRRAQDALCRALARSCRAGRKNPKNPPFAARSSRVPRRAQRRRSATQTAACAFQHRRRRKNARSIPLLIYRYPLH